MMAAPQDGGAWRIRTMMVREAAPETSAIGEHLKGPADAFRLMELLYGVEPQEVFVGFYLNARHRIAAYQEITRGIADSSLIHPRELFRGAILANACSVIVAHNHPSGDPTPSPEDHAVTRHLAAAGRTVGIPLLDHIVVGHGCYQSLADDCGVGS